MRSIPFVTAVVLAVATLACATDTTVDPGGMPPNEDGPGDAIPANAERLPVETLYQDASSGVEADRREVFRSDTAWRSFWEMANANRTGAGPAPEIDFEDSMVVVAAMGRRSTGGYAIAIAGVYDTGGGIVTEVVETEPGPGCLTTQALTAPAVAVKVDRRTGDASWLVRKETTDC